jgi:hypothetical protein
MEYDEQFQIQEKEPSVFHWRRGKQRIMIAKLNRSSFRGSHRKRNREEKT